MTAFTDTGSKLITGVAYTDAVTKDNFYTPGEGLVGATITAMPVGGEASVSTTTLPSGGYSLPITGTDTCNLVASGPGFATPISFSGVVVGINKVKRDFTPAATLPAVNSLVVNDGSAQLGRVRSLTVTFNQNVFLDSGAMTIAGRSSVGAGTTLSYANPSGHLRTWVVTFGGTPVIGGSPADGLYDFTVVASKVHAGSAGAATMAANYTSVVRRLYGDSDNGISINDFNQLYTRFGKSPSGRYGEVCRAGETLRIANTAVSGASRDGAALYVKGVTARVDLSQLNSIVLTTCDSGTPPSLSRLELFVIHK